MANQGGMGGAPREEFKEGSAKGPSSSTSESGLEGSILEDDDKRTTAGSKSTGAGAEASEGMHAADGGQSPHDKTALTGKGTGREGASEPDRKGSEPMDRNQEHKGSYGGEGGAPRNSSDQRESHGRGGSK